MNIHLIRTDGSEEHLNSQFNAIPDLIGAETMDSVDLRDGRVMLVDDNGYDTDKLINQKATRLYHGVCKPGTTHQIIGDVAIVIDAECQ